MILYLLGHITSVIDYSNHLISVFLYLIHPSNEEKVLFITSDIYIIPTYHDLCLINLSL